MDAGRPTKTKDLAPTVLLRLRKEGFLFVREPLLERCSASSHPSCSRALPTGASRPPFCNFTSPFSAANVLMHCSMAHNHSHMLLGWDFPEVSAGLPAHSGQLEQRNQWQSCLNVTRSSLHGYFQYNPRENFVLLPMPLLKKFGIISTFRISLLKI